MFLGVLCVLAVCYRKLAAAELAAEANEADEDE
jgi:hypothetical protein